MHSTLAELSVYDDAYNLKRKIIDEQSYMIGVYVYKALDVALYNFGIGLNPKSKLKPKDYLKKPFMVDEEVEKQLEDMTDEELDAEIQKAIMIEQEYMNKSKLPKTRIARR